MMHKAWRSIEEVPIVFLGHPSNFSVTRAEKLTIWIQFEITRPVAAIKWIQFEITRPVAAIKSLRFALLFLDLYKYYSK